MQLFLDLDIKIEDNKCVYKLYDKRDEFPFFVGRMPDRRSNIPSYIFYGTIRSEIIRLARSTLLLDDFILRVSALFKRMMNQGADRLKMLQHYTRACVNHSLSFDKFASSSDDIIRRVFQEMD